jgi:hypothetical protein
MGHFSYERPQGRDVCVLQRPHNCKVSLSEAKDSGEVVHSSEHHTERVCLGDVERKDARFECRRDGDWKLLAEPLVKLDFLDM